MIVQMQRASALANKDSLSKDAATRDSGFRALLSSLPQKVLSNLFPLTLLALKFSQWWYSPASPRLSHGEASGESHNRVKLPPPRMILPAEKGWSNLNHRRRRTPKVQDEQSGSTAGHDTALDSDEDDEWDKVEDVEDVDKDRMPLAQRRGSSSSSSSGESLPTTPPNEQTRLPSSQTSQKAITNSPVKALPYGTCPLCGVQPWANPTATPTGYVGCYVCLYRFVEANGKCPVTGVDLEAMGGVDSLRKVLV